MFLTPDIHRYTQNSFLKFWSLLFKKIVHGCLNITTPYNLVLKLTLALFPWTWGWWWALHIGLVRCPSLPLGSFGWQRHFANRSAARNAAIDLPLSWSSRLPSLQLCWSVVGATLERLVFSWELRRKHRQIQRKHELNILRFGVHVYK